ncbi:MAG: MaoC family dehydratase N-terminal domain-containing protein [Candidatus Dormibacteraeota bacterium]|nr:MaoC family dehydratase N-terminal domain-containing protein [Candidatus Dormibacteraeota bacterium]
MAEFARAIGAEPGAGVPPTYAAVYALFATASLLFADADAAVDFAHLLHSEQEFRWERHPEVAETIRASGVVQEDAERRGMRFITFTTEVTSGGSALCTSVMVDVIRS